MWWAPHGPGPSPERRRPTGTTTGTGKAASVYANLDDPAVLVGARVTFGWTVNLGNPIAWLLVVGFLALPAGLVIAKVATGI